MDAIFKISWKFEYTTELVDIIESNQEKDLLLQEQNTGKKVRNDFISQRIELMRRSRNHIKRS